ncbi:MAG: STAS domain-containing protein [Phycisphaera sp.]|nr:STAS domain-containing protein [Phycisphaera sp.]
MPIQQWSDDILMVELNDEPVFSEEIQALSDRVDKGPDCHVVLNLGNITRLNSSNISQLLRIRKKQINKDVQLRICSVPDSLWGVMLITGLDKIFDFQSDVPSALASLQIDGDDEG